MNRKAKISVLVLAAVTFGLAGGAANADTPPDLPATELRQQLDAFVAGGAASAALLRVDDGRTHWSGASGVSDLDTGSPARADGYFRIGSVTKTFVSTVVMQLVDEGRVDLDESIDSYLPGLVPNGGVITVRQLLNHSSGLHDYMSEPGYSTNKWRGDDRFRSYEPAELLDVAFARKPYFDTPGDDGGLPEPHAHGYTTVEGELVDATEMNPSLDWAAGEMLSTTEDLNRFFDALLSGDLTSADSLAAMRETVATGTIFRYGLGLQRFDLPCGMSITGHGGQLLGYLTYAVRDDAGRAATLSYNPYLKLATEAEVVGLMSAAFCPA